MIQELFEECLSDEAKELFVKMEQNGCLPNDVVYNTVIRGLLGQQKYNEAMSLLEKMVGREFSPNTYAFALIANLISTKGQDLALEEVIKEVSF